MIIIGDKIISDNLFDVKFVCNLEKCKGACCVEGDNGAPLFEEEITFLNEHLGTIETYLPQKQKELLNAVGFYETDEDGDLVTTCLPSGECVFSKRNEVGVLECMVEKAFLDGKTDFKKPVSCHLYPIRVSQIGEYTVLNYHQWDICSAACDLGNELNIPVFRFLKDPIVRAFDLEFYNELEKVFEAKQKTNSTL